MSVKIIPLADGRSKLECFNPSTNEPLRDLTTIALPEFAELVDEFSIGRKDCDTVIMRISHINIAVWGDA